MKWGPQPAAGKRLCSIPAEEERWFLRYGRRTPSRRFTFTPLSWKLANVANDDLRVKGIKFTGHGSRRTRQLRSTHLATRNWSSSRVADEYFALPDDTWKAGDDVRYYFKQPGQALRMMNVTATNVMKG